MLPLLQHPGKASVSEFKSQNLHRTEERHQERDAEIEHAAVEDRHHGIGFSCGLRDDRQGGIESRGAADRNGGQRPEPPGDEGRGQQREQLAHDIAEQCHGSQLRTPEIGDEDTRKRVVAEPSADGHRVPGRKRRQEQCRQGSAGQRTDGRHHGQQRQPRIEPPDTSREGRIVAEGDPHAKHQGIEHIGAEARPRHVERQGGGVPRQTSCDEKGDDHQTPPQGAPHRKRRIRPAYDVLPRNTPGVLSGTLFPGLLFTYLEPLKSSSSFSSEIIL